MTTARYHVCAVKVMMIPRNIMSIVNDQNVYDKAISTCHIFHAYKIFLLDHSV